MKKMIMNAAAMMLQSIAEKKENDAPPQSKEDKPVGYVPVYRPVDDKEKKRKRREANKSRKINQHKAKRK